MRALTLHQPWASLVALGVKRIETRSWPAPKALIGQRLAIHAAKAVPSNVRGFTATKAYWLNGQPAPMWHAALKRHAGDWFEKGDWGCYEMRWPLGAIVASATVTACVPIGHTGEDPDQVDVSDQAAYGDFAPGRWAWLLDDIAPTTDRCPSCWGEGEVPYMEYLSEFVVRPDFTTCWRCRGEGRCDPIPAKGRQRLWNWEPS